MRLLALAATSDRLTQCIVNQYYLPVMWWKRMILRMNWSVVLKQDAKKAFEQAFPLVDKWYGDKTDAALAKFILFLCYFIDLILFCVYHCMWNRTK